MSDSELTTKQRWMLARRPRKFKVSGRIAAFAVVMVLITIGAALVFGSHIR